MQEAVQKEILKAFLLVLKPMARVLLRFGISYKDFNEIAKSAFVEVASSDYGIRGRPTNISRVAVMTGMTRKEVRRLRDNLDSGDEVVTVKHAPLLQLIRNWYVEKEFAAESGGPATLPFLGPEKSFESLVKWTGGDIPPGAIRTELKRVGAVVENDDGSLKLVNRTFLPSESHDNLISTLVRIVYPMMANLAHNTNPDMPSFTMPNKSAYTTTIRLTDVPRIRRISGDRIEAFAEAMDDVFTSYELLQEGAPDEPTAGETATIHVATFYHEEVNTG